MVVVWDVLAFQLHRRKRNRGGFWTCANSFFFLGARSDPVIFTCAILWGPPWKLKNAKNPGFFPKTMTRMVKKKGVLRSIRWRNPHLQPGFVPSITLNVHGEVKLAQVYLLDV